MTEIITPVKQLLDAQGEQYFIITPKHTIADVYRLCVEQEWWEEMNAIDAVDNPKSQPDLTNPAKSEKSTGLAELYHPCTSILIEGLKRLKGGREILSDWDKARRVIDSKYKTTCLTKQQHEIANIEKRGGVSSNE